MNHFFRLSHSGSCYFFSAKYSDRSFICSGCLRNRQILPINNACLSTYESPLMECVVKRKKVNDKKLKETELLKVTNSQATQKTMTVGKLNASHITAFANAPGMILNNIGTSKYKKEINKRKVLRQNVLETDISSKSHYNSRKKIAPETGNDSQCTGHSEKFISFIMDNHRSDYNEFSTSSIKGGNKSVITSKNNYPIQENVNSTSIPEFCKSEKNAAFTAKSEKLFEKSESDLFTENSNIKESTTSDIIREISSSSQKPDLHTVFQTKNFDFDEMDNTDLLFLSYVDACINSGMLNSATELLNTGRVKEITKSNIYDLVLQAHAKKGHWTEVQKIIILMQEREIPLSCESFALYLDCLFRVPETLDYKRNVAKAVLTRFQSMGYRIADLFEKTKINHQERENILQVVRWFYPSFEASQPSFSDDDVCNLASDFYKGNCAARSPLPCFTEDQMAAAIMEQLSLEEKPICEIQSVVKRGIYSSKSVETWSGLMKLWEKNLRVNFMRHLNALKRQVEGKCHEPNIYPFLNCLPVEDFVNEMCLEIHRLFLSSDGFTPSTCYLYKNAGIRIWYRYCVKKKLQCDELLSKYNEFVRMYASWYLKPTETVKTGREKWLRLLWDNPDLKLMGVRNVSWPDAVKVKIGKFLFDIIFKSAIIPPNILCNINQKDMVPAFYLILRSSKGILSEQIKFHPAVGSLYRRANINILHFDVKDLPMLCPPKPWTSVDSGGFYILPTRFMRPTRFNLNMKILRSIPQKKLSVIFDSLNELQSVAWTVNEKVLDIVIKIFEDGGSKELDVPVYPDMSPTLEPDEKLTGELKLAAYYKRLKLIQERNDCFGLWCEGLYRLSLANHFRKKVFWLPLNLDFRGRVYPIPPHISHTSSDLYRSLLLFARKERLGEKGLDWLKIHAINLTGTHNKRPLIERLNYANENLDNILDSAENPLDGRRWWTKSEEPWQTLAACFEIRNAIESGDPENYETGFPVHQDGSCNGLQHYAALGRDSIGAASVNLKPSAEPQDVYTVVANIVEEIRKKDAAKGVKIASILEGFITRKIVKRTVMTTVYGVTLYGARLQISQQLEDVKEFPEERIREASLYLCTKVFEALKEMFTSAKEIQDWFLKCASLITNSYGQSVSWTTPLGLPVTQPYFKSTFSGGRTNLRPDTRKQNNAFPPNFIHSLDSSHMMLTALYCGQAGLCFASVHDCFWTHPINVDVMNKICREQFIALHSEDILYDLASHFLRTYSCQAKSLHKVLVDVPKTGNFDLRSVLDSVYFFS